MRGGRCTRCCLPCTSGLAYLPGASPHASPSSPPLLSLSSLSSQHLRRQGGMPAAWRPSAWAISPAAGRLVGAQIAEVAMYPHSSHPPLPGRGPSLRSLAFLRLSRPLPMFGLTGLLECRSGWFAYVLMPIAIRETIQEKMVWHMPCVVGFVDVCDDTRTPVYAATLPAMGRCDCGSTIFAQPQAQTELDF